MIIQRLILNTRLAGSSYAKGHLHILMMNKLLGEGTAACFPGMFQLNEGKLLQGGPPTFYCSLVSFTEMDSAEYTVVLYTYMQKGRV